MLCSVFFIEIREKLRDSREEEDYLELLLFPLFFFLSSIRSFESYFNF